MILLLLNLSLIFIVFTAMIVFISLYNSTRSRGGARSPVHTRRVSAHALDETNPPKRLLKQTLYSRFKADLTAVSETARASQTHQGRHFLYFC